MGMDDTASNDILIEYTQRIIDHTAMLIAEAEGKIKRQMNETEDTDS